MTTMATANRRLLKWFTSRNPQSVFIKILPIISILIYIIISRYDGQLFQLIFAYIIGVVVWSFMEYCIHRWIYHISYRNRNIKWFVDSFHIHHHRNLTDYEVLNAGFLLVYPIFIIIWILVYITVGDLVVSAATCLGIVLYYFFYENVHYYIHYRAYKSGYMKFIQSYHLHHHYKKWNKNYGNTTSVWDRILGTYDATYKSLILTDEQKKFFILSNKNTHFSN